MEPSLKAQAETRARELGLSFSEYARGCIAKDIAHGGDFVISPKKKAAGNQPGTKTTRS